MPRPETRARKSSAGTLLSTVMLLAIIFTTTWLRTGVAAHDIVRRRRPHFRLAAVLLLPAARASLSRVRAARGSPAPHLVRVAQTEQRPLDRTSGRCSAHPSRAPRARCCRRRRRPLSSHVRTVVGICMYAATDCKPRPWPHCISVRGSRDGCN